MQCCSVLFEIDRCSSLELFWSRVSSGRPSACTSRSDGLAEDIPSSDWPVTARRGLQAGKQRDGPVSEAVHEARGFLWVFACQVSTLSDTRAMVLCMQSLGCLDGNGSCSCEPRSIVASLYPSSLGS